jgi:drug/metabolite transporter (DMT)-like permease
MLKLRMIAYIARPSSPCSTERRALVRKMSPHDILAALSIAIVWGLTFIPTKIGVGETSPLMLAALRFLFAAIPMVVIGPPKAPA